MFETSVIRAQVRPARSRLAVIIATVTVHSAVIIGTVAISIASTEFPDAAPREYQRAPVFAVVQIPPPLGNPNGGAQPHNTQPQQPATETCPHCQGQVQAGSKFCNNCGQSLQPQACKNCNTPVPAGSKFCGNCGTPT